MINIKKVILFFCASMLAGCDQGADSPRGFSLPQGDVEAGEIAVKKHNCLACHNIDGLDNSTINSELDKRVKLGVASAKITTYAELVTSIINPSHRIARKHGQITSDENDESLMLNYNDVMTVTELVDIVAYLQPKYRVTPLTYTPYSPYYMSFSEKP